MNAYGTPVLEREHGVGSVVLRRGALLSDSFVARFSEPQYMQVGSELNASLRIERRDLVVHIADCEIHGEAVKPQRGDEFVDGTDVWVVYAPDDTTPPTITLDAFKYQVHVQKQT